MGCCCCHLCLGPYAEGGADWCCEIAQSCGLPPPKALAFGQIGWQVGWFDGLRGGGLSGRLAGEFDGWRAGGLAGWLIGGHPWNWCLWVHGACDPSVIIDMVVGTLGGACTLGTCCMFRVSSGVVVSSNLLECTYK